MAQINCVCYQETGILAESIRWLGQVNREPFNIVHNDDLDRRMTWLGGMPHYLWINGGLVHLPRRSDRRPASPAVPSRLLMLLSLATSDIRFLGFMHGEKISNGGSEREKKKTLVTAQSTSCSAVVLSTQTVQLH